MHLLGELVLTLFAVAPRGAKMLRPPTTSLTAPERATPSRGTTWRTFLASRPEPCLADRPLLSLGGFRDSDQEITIIVNTKLLVTVLL